ncbi:hypothetical protein FRC09_014299 [Ceratobasidium sp. 395]|nr:hypothetical protein FRC09_014299 [Ceratobasidium sp. 395]
MPKKGKAASCTPTPSSHSISPIASPSDAPTAGPGRAGRKLLPSLQSELVESEDDIARQSLLVHMDWLARPVTLRCTMPMTTTRPASGRTRKWNQQKHPKKDIEDGLAEMWELQRLMQHGSPDEYVRAICCIPVILQFMADCVTQDACSAVWMHFMTYNKDRQPHNFITGSHEFLTLAAETDRVVLRDALREVYITAHCTFAATNIQAWIGDLLQQISDSADERKMSAIKLPTFGHGLSFKDAILASPLSSLLNTAILPSNDDSFVIQDNKVNKAGAPAEPAVPLEPAPGTSMSRSTSAGSKCPLKMPKNAELFALSAQPERYSPLHQYKVQSKKIETEKIRAVDKAVPKKKTNKKPTGKAKSLIVDNDGDNDVQEIAKPLSLTRDDVATTISSTHPLPDVQNAQLPAVQPCARPCAKSSTAEN